MKKIFATIAALVIAAGAAFAQSMAEATEIAQLANEAVAAEDYETALNGWKEALAKAEACGEEGAELVATAKGQIPAIINAAAKKLLKEKNYDGAVAKLQDAVAAAKEYGAEDIAEKAAALIPQAFLSQGSDLIKAKDFGGAATAFKKVLDIEPTNGNASLYLGMALASSGDVAGATEAYKNAAANGQEKSANKQLGNLCLKLASNALKAKDYKGAMEQAVESTKYVPDNANAFKIAGTAAAQLKNYKDAASFFEEYLKVSPDAKDAEAIKANIEAFKKLK